ncbi:aldehyde dehydrogenase (NADP(+)) [Phytomonospora sp. NPDC050363]|uniref:aldehyde dehydrogenase (NADP(+)) n=1 Tax=Phytomonospora sp. NPDC050363 TaxID=3155642 RepID=UPI0033DA18AA
MTDVPSIDPSTGEIAEIDYRSAPETTPEQVDRLCRAAASAAEPLEALGRDGRASLLDALAEALEGAGDRIVAVADRETGLGATRLTGELARTCYQLRLFAEVLRDGGYLEATVDHAGDTPMGPRPDLRRMLVPVGPVAVFGASNFPLAFSVPGGDTASALAAGAPVVVKAHGSHPATSQLCFDVLAAAATAAGAPDGTLGLVHGQQAGADLVAHPEIRAVGFTGSTGGARALLKIIEGRPDPIPFFGELSSLNPVVVTAGAALDRAARLGAEIAASFTLGAGQFCTKPGLVFVPSGDAGDEVVTAMGEAITSAAPMVMLNEGIAAAYGKGAGLLGATAGIEEAARGATDDDAPGFRGTPRLLTTTAADLPPEATEECFGPLTVVARYSGEAELFTALATLPSSLTATIHKGPAEVELPGRLDRRLRRLAGRILYDGQPTGVAVSWAQHHGGPWPATNSQHTSVGTSAIRRFLRPVTWQNAPAELLPEELREGYDGVPRRVDGVLRVGRG